MRRLPSTDLAAPPVPCVRCGDKSYAAGRHPERICLICEATHRRKAGK